jgi:HAD superfamily hydrolase (TIGR01662 family)
MKIKAVLLDLDGTLRDTRDAIYGAYQHAIKTHSGRDVGRDEIKPHVHHHTVVHQAFASHVPTDDFTATYMDKVYKDLDDVGLYEGVEALLDDLQQAGYRLAIVTSATQDKTEQFLERRGLAGRFQAIVGMTPGWRPKPAPDLLQTALEKLGCKPSEAIMLGDMTVDIAAAHAAGMPCVAITHGFATQQELEVAGADYIIDSLGELQDLLNQLTR